MSYTVTLHCKPYVKQWLVKQYGNPVLLPRRSNIREVFLTCCEKSFHPSRDYNKDKYPEQVEIIVNSHDISEHGNFIKTSLHHYLNKTFENIITAELFLFIFSHQVNDSSIDDGIKTYQMIMGFNESIFSFDAIRSKYFRYKENLKKNFSTSATKTKGHVTELA